MLKEIGQTDNKKTLAKRIIQNVLSDHDVPSRVILRKLQYINISERTISKAKKELGIVSYRTEKEWYWHLPGKKETGTLEDDQ